MADEFCDRSRLACQIKITEDLDGLTRHHHDTHHSSTGTSRPRVPLPTQGLPCASSHPRHPRRFRSLLLTAPWLLRRAVRAHSRILDFPTGYAVENALIGGPDLGLISPQS